MNISSTLSSIEPSIPGTGGYGIGTIGEEAEQPFSIHIPIPIPQDEDTNNSLTFKITLAYADLPGASLANDLNLAVVSATKQRHGNQGNQEFAAGATRPFDRRNNVEQVVWPQVAGESLEVVVRPYRIMLADVPFAYAWTFLRG